PFTGSDAETLFAREQMLLDQMMEIAKQSRSLPDGRILRLIDWIRENQCHDLPALGKRGNGTAKWNDTRVIIFTEDDDTSRYLQQQLQAAIEGTDRADSRIAVFAGTTPESPRANSDVISRQEIRLAFNAEPGKHPIRILIATDAAREGLN